MVERDLRRVASDLAEAARSAAGDPVAAGRLADLHDRAAAAQRRLAEIDAALDRAQGRLVDEEALRQGLARFDGAWEQLSPKERARMVALLVGRVDHDPVAGEVTLTFLPCALRSLGQVECEQEARA